MDFPFLLLLLLALPFMVGAFIVVVSRIRRRRHAPAGGPVPVHRGQADTGAVQDATHHPGAGARKVESGRDRRAGSPKKR